MTDIQFVSITDTDKLMTLAHALIGREQEIHMYDVNISNYTAVLAGLPSGEWPDLISSYKNTPIEMVPSDLQQNVSDYSFRDRVRGLLASENLERSKSVRIYEAIKSQIPSDQLATLVTQAKSGS